MVIVLSFPSFENVVDFRSFAHKTEVKSGRRNEFDYDICIKLGSLGRDISSADARLIITSLGATG